MSSLRVFFLKNLGLKGVSLLLAFLLWHQVASQRTFQKTVDVPVEFSNMPQDLEISNDYPRQVRVALRSDSEGAPQLTAVVDLETAQPGTLEVPLTEQNISPLPAGVEILRIHPSKFALQLEKTRKENVAVQARLTGDPAPGYMVSAVRVAPAKVRVAGPESRVRQAQRAYTGVIDISGRSESFTQTTFIDLEDEQLRIDDVFSVTVAVSIEERRRRVKVKGVPVQIGPEQVKGKLYTRKVDLDGSVPISYKGNLNAELFRAQVDLSSAKPGREPQELKPEIVIPEEYQDVFRLSGVSPAMIKARRDR